VIARSSRAIQRKELDPPVKPEDDGIEFDFYALRSWRSVVNKEHTFMEQNVVYFLVKYH
jgi:hypothetical protein